MKVMVLSHPVNTRCFEVLFSEDGKKYTTVDGITKDRITTSMGYTLHSVKDFPKNSPAPYRIMAKALAEKIVLLDYNVSSYEDKNRYLQMFKKIGIKLYNIQSNMIEDFDIPEIVWTLISTPIIYNTN